jgi:DNA-binding beta-propeller fold protein YncE/mono/diheme cytochrome c family protein
MSVVFGRRLNYLQNQTWIILIFLATIHLSLKASQNSDWIAPNGVVIDFSGNFAFVTGYQSRTLFAINLSHGTRKDLASFTEPCTGMASIDDKLIITCSGNENWCYIVEQKDGSQQSRFKAGHGVCAPVVGSKKQRFYICNRFDHSVGVYDLPSTRLVTTIPAVREPIAAVLSPDERFLVVCNLLPKGPADAQTLTSMVTIIDTTRLCVWTNLALPNGTTSTRGVAISPSGQWCAVVHNIARFQVPTTQVEQGWMNESALTLIDLTNGRRAATVLLDEPERGTANPWALAFSLDGNVLAVTHSGTHDLSLIDFPALLAKLTGEMDGRVVDNFTFLKGVRKRVALSGNGPRSMSVTKNGLVVAGYFSDTLEQVDLSQTNNASRLLWKSPSFNLKINEGERLFHDATICHQQWQSCASCHPDARADGLNWDLLNDGIGNPKNTKSLLLSPQTSPSMSLGIRTGADKAVRSGLRGILFALRPEEEARAIDLYLSELKPYPSPRLVNGSLSPAAEKGKVLFKTTGCAQCHNGPYMTNRRSYNVGTGKGPESDLAFDTPSLIEVWRTAPYLHDGSAVTVTDIFQKHNYSNRHGKTSQLTEDELRCLAEYVLSL